MNLVSYDIATTCVCVHCIFGSLTLSACTRVTVVVLCECVYVCYHTSCYIPDLGVIKLPVSFYIYVLCGFH